MGCLKIEKISDNAIASIYTIVMTECKYYSNEDMRNICKTCKEDMCTDFVTFESSKERTCAIATTIRNVEGSFLNIVSITKRFTEFKEQIIDFVIKYNKSIGIEVNKNTFIEIINCDIFDMYNVSQTPIKK